MITISNSSAKEGGAIAAYTFSNITFKGNSTVHLESNSLNSHHGVGEAMIIVNNNVITFEENFTVTFNGNKAYGGGAVHTRKYSKFTCKGNSNISFSNNTADGNSGGALTIAEFSSSTFKENSSIVFINNTAKNIAGAMMIYNNSAATIEDYSTLVFERNSANAQDGGAMMIDGSAIKFTEHSTAVFFKLVVIELTILVEQ